MEGGHSPTPVAGSSGADGDLTLATIHESRVSSRWCVSLVIAGGDVSSPIPTPGPASIVEAFAV
ncbi:MAG: hypothetical protein DYH08_10245 [Actinobacteria bacterium ATB1]|nr:hypothetical protein [Actinobacteria bacterium ATB1]